MPGVPSLALFANVTTASTVDLDHNFTNCATLLKTVSNYTPYVTDAGAVNAYLCTFTGGTVFTLVEGVGLVFKAANATTGASNLNVNGTGTKAIKNINGTDLSSGQIPLNGVVHVVYDGTNYILQSSATGSGASAATPYKNAIMNGVFQVWQRGAVLSSVADNTVTADRWRYRKVGTMVHDISRSTDVPTVAQAGRLFQYSMLIDCTTADAAIVATDYAYIRQVIEGYSWVPFAQRACIISFWVKATKIGIYCVGLSNLGGDRCFVGEYQVNVSDTWEYKSVTIVASPSAGTWDYTNDVGLYVYFPLAAGSSLQTSAGAWQVTASAAFATSNQVNACDSNANNFRLCGVMFEAGLTAHEVEPVQLSDEIARCQRYFETSFVNMVQPQSNSGIGGATMGVQTVGAVTGQGLGLYQRYNVQKRTNAPVVTFYNPSAANSNIRNTSVLADCTTGALVTNNIAWYVSLTTSAGSGVGNAMAVHWTSDAEL